MKPWYGPAPTLEEQLQNEQLLTEYFQQFPQSDLRHKYKKVYSSAMISRFYDEINELYKQGKITQAQYDEALDKILPYINIESITSC